MSAFVVDKTHIDAILTAALELTRPGDSLYWYDPSAEQGARPNFLTRETAGRVGAVLWAENVRSVNYRYREDEIEQAYEFTRLRGHPTPVALMSLLHGFEYQACEHPGWRDSEAHAIVRRLERLAMTRLPGYSDAPWSVSDSQTDVFVAPARRR